jgi:hypothetical protein
MAVGPLARYRQRRFTEFAASTYVNHELQRQTIANNLQFNRARNTSDPASATRTRFDAKEGVSTQVIRGMKQVSHK